MRTGKFTLIRWRVAALLIGLVLAFAGSVHAHCDTLDGPVVAAAREALKKKDVMPVLKWVRPQDEPEIRKLFQETLAVRQENKQARELADMYFFETLVRVHRAGEGAPYTGLKPAGKVEPPIAAADKAIESGSPDRLIQMVTDEAASGIRERFRHVQEAKKRANDSVEAGREYVEAYVDYTHYVERLYGDASSGEAHNEGKSPEQPH